MIIMYLRLVNSSRDRELFVRVAMTTSISATAVPAGYPPSPILTMFNNFKDADLIVVGPETKENHVSVMSYKESFFVGLLKFGLFLLNNFFTLQNLSYRRSKYCYILIIKKERECDFFSLNVLRRTDW